MKTRMDFTQRQTSVVLAALLACFLLACFETNAYSQDAKLNLSRLDKLASRASKVVNVNVEGPMLKLAAESMNSKAHPHGNDEAAQAMLQRLKGVYVRTYEFTKPGEYSRADVEDILKQVRSGGWTNIVNVEQKNENKTVGIYVMKEGGEAIGMAIIVVKPEKLVVVNLVGPIDFAQFGGFGSLGIIGDSVGGLQEGSKPSNRTPTPNH